MTGLPIVQVVGVGLSGPESLSPAALAIVESATLLIGAQRHLEAFNYLAAVEALPLGNFTQMFAELRSRLQSDPNIQAVVLASGDPLFFGIGRLLLSAFPAEQLIFHPQVSAIQLAFSRLKLPWQDATLVSVHGRDQQLLAKALKRGDRKIAVLTDTVLTPSAIAQLIDALDSPVRYQLWVCENLGSDHEVVRSLSPQTWRTWQSQTFAPLNVVVLLRLEQPLARAEALPVIGLPDSTFEGFSDRPTLMTKREIRLLILGALAPLNGQILWDIGAGTGTVSIELSRLCPTAKLYAIEKTAMGAALIARNARRLAIAPIQIIQGQAPEALKNLPIPDGVFIGGSSGQLMAILDFLTAQMMPSSLTAASADLEDIPERRIVLALATVEHIAQVVAWVGQPENARIWDVQMTQVNIARSHPVGPLTRFSPLTPITLVLLRSFSARRYCE
ncbi:MAG: precorrin-6y C5,15-methyltransferase (decarboxylating) subunit CbiE [Phormidesmis sp.]